jgi:hypothetical protein
LEILVANFSYARMLAHKRRIDYGCTEMRR